MGRGGVGWGGVGEEGGDAPAMRSGVCSWLSGTLLGLGRRFLKMCQPPRFLWGRGQGGAGVGALSFSLSQMQKGDSSRRWRGRRLRLPRQQRAAEGGPVEGAWTRAYQIPAPAFAP